MFLNKGTTYHRTTNKSNFLQILWDMVWIWLVETLLKTNFPYKEKRVHMVDRAAIITVNDGHHHQGWDFSKQEWFACDCVPEDLAH